MNIALAVVYLLACATFQSLAAPTFTRAKRNSGLYKHFRPEDTCPERDSAREKACHTSGCSSSLLAGLYKVPPDSVILIEGEDGDVQVTEKFYAAFGSEDKFVERNHATEIPINPLSGANVSLDKPTALGGQLVIAVQRDYPEACCRACNRKYVGGAGPPAYGFDCGFWQYFYLNGPDSNLGLCYLFEDIDFHPQCANATMSTYSLSFFGKRCSSRSMPASTPPAGQVAPFEWSRVPSAFFTLISDQHLVVNAKLTGYLDSRLAGAAILKEGKAARAWMTEVGVVWAERTGGRTHRLRFVARTGKERDRGAGFLAAGELDGKVLPKLEVGKEFKQGDMTLTFKWTGTRGGAEMDQYQLKIRNVVDMELHVHLAHSLLQLPDDAFAHFSMALSFFKATKKIHGVLGQIHRHDHDHRTVKFPRVAAALLHNVEADDVEGVAVLEGTSEDYQVSSVFSTDFKFSEFTGERGS